VRHDISDLRTEFSDSFESIKYNVIAFLFAATDSPRMWIEKNSVFKAFSGYILQSGIK
jgi:hypothetical protein